MICPICKVGLQQAIFYGTEIDYCPNCLGFWFEEEELRWAKDKKDKNLSWLDIDLWEDKKKFRISSGQKLCPYCRLPLYEVRYGDSKIKVDVCNICRGTWLDRGEFQQIIQYLKDRAGDELLHHYAKNAAKEFWEIFTGPETLREEILDFLIVLKCLGYKLTAQHSVINKIIAKLPK